MKAGLFMVLGCLLLGCNRKPSIGDRVELFQEFETLDRLNIPYGITFAIGEDGNRYFDSLEFLRERAEKARDSANGWEWESELGRFQNHPRFFSKIANHTDAIILDTSWIWVKVKIIENPMTGWGYKIGWVIESAVKKP